MHKPYPHETRILIRSLLSSIRPLPSFLILGAQRAGTTTLFANLATHPDIRPPIRKEIHFFTRWFERGISWYRAHFPILIEAQRRWLTFEATPYYLFHPLVPARVRDVLPSARFIVILRDPVDRAWSHYMLNVELQREQLSFGRALEAEAQRLSISIDRDQASAIELNQHQVYSYLARGRYVEQVERWFSTFGRERFHFIDFAEMAHDLHSTLSGTLTFLDVRDIQRRTLIRAGMDTSELGSEKPNLDQLSEYYRPHNERLFRLLGRSFSWK